MKNPYFEYLAILKCSELRKLYYRTLAETMFAANLSVAERDYLKNVFGQVSHPNLGRKRRLADLKFGQDAIIAWLQNLGKRLKIQQTKETESYISELSKALSERQKQSLDEIFDYLAQNYARRLLEHSCNVIDNPVHNFETADIKAAFTAGKEFHPVPQIPGLRGTFVLTKDYFDFVGEVPPAFTHQELRRQFLYVCFASLFSYGKLLDRESIYFKSLETNVAAG